MVLIPGGPFTMGTNEIDEDGMGEAFGIPEKLFVDEHPEREVSLPPFYMDIKEVSNEQYKKFIDETGHAPPPKWQGIEFPAGMDNMPVTYVSFFDALSYAKWAGKRLPTEEEWEKAARGTDGRIYPWGKMFDKKKANLTTSTSDDSDLKPGGSFPDGKSPYGVHDLIGNVWEWTTGWYDAYPGNNAKKETFGKRLRVLRGFSYFAIGHFPDTEYEEIVSHLARALYRESADPHEKNIDVGFRCVKDV
ncbi:MAG: formylglycine-generating enzyme family protein [Nitrospinota bacterium]